ncbi:MAG TPA: RDD family protein [Isosphaeraceae bacterium]|nr:RDD family protein [Isosphaeraceae bacterium]
MEQLSLDAKGSALGDRLAEAWPRRKRDQLALAEDSLPCAWHNRPAVLVCVRCHAPYCNRCRAKPFRKQFFLCRRCQVGMWNRRVVAMIFDICMFLYFPIIVAGIIAGAVFGAGETVASLLIFIIDLIGVGLLFVRDSLLRGAGLGKRSAGLRVVQSRDGKTPLTIGQGVLRWLSQFVPIFNLVDAAAAYSDPLLRRYGDRWAGTRVIDTEKKLAKDRDKIARRLIKRGVQLPPKFGLTMEGLARLV